ncbi:rhomboid family intramembrane serine protease [Jannaschia sp. Os4]|uniref:rhomboid family intramembrane serine protease n=1 Tax=Jannaschia sp. Os4 TaxID=2807617 RepID=UPI00193A4F4C|nr:rhomboid family intramembrane serine protease [Jannaschia sp. Os4]MBM2575376.1 rhomboid family intramembrane serine protease [Jannaschia sp. Os4]
MAVDPRNQSPFNAIPPVVLGLAALIAGVEMTFQLAQAGLLSGGREARIAAIRDWSVLDVVWDWMRANGAWLSPEALRWVAYPFVHGGFGHAAMVVVFVLALGNVIGDVVRGWRLLVLFFVPALAGGLAYVVLLDPPAPLFGGYAGAYGLIGAFTWLVRRGMTRLAIDPDRAFLLLGFLLAIQPVFGLVSGSFAWVGDWVAEAVGAAVGYALCGTLVPGGGRAVVTRMRRR